MIECVKVVREIYENKFESKVGDAIEELQKSGLDADIDYKTVIDNHNTIYHIAYITGYNME